MYGVYVGRRREEEEGRKKTGEEAEDQQKYYVRCMEYTHSLADAHTRPHASSRAAGGRDVVSARVLSGSCLGLDKCQPARAGAGDMRTKAKEVKGQARATEHGHTRAPKDEGSEHNDTTTQGRPRATRSKTKNPGPCLKRCKPARPIEDSGKGRCGNRASVEKRVCLDYFTRVPDGKRVSEEIDRLGTVRPLTANSSRDGCEWGTGQWPGLWCLASGP